MHHLDLGTFSIGEAPLRVSLVLPMHIIRCICHQLLSGSTP